MKKLPILGTLLVIAMTVTGCGGEPTPETVELPPPETFTWTSGQPISFSPPPRGWERSRYQNGGTEGVDFVKTGSGGEQILVAERFFVGNRDRCERIQELRRDLNNLDRTTFERDLLRARLYADEPFNGNEARMIDVVNYTLDRARDAYQSGDTAIASSELGTALEQAARIRFTIDETVDRALFTADRNPVYPNLEVEQPQAGQLAGEPIVTVNFTFQPRDVPFLGRRIYVLKNNRMFELGYQGREENLPLFERILATITFPPGPCEH